MLDDWLADAAAASTPMRASRCSQLPGDDDPPPAVLARLVELLEADEDRSVVPVRVFWIPGGLPTRSKVVALLSRPGHLPSAEVAAARHPSQGSRRAPGWSPASRRRSPSCASSGATPPSPRTPATSRDSSMRRAEPGDRARRAAAARPGVQVATAGQAGDAGVQPGFARGSSRSPVPPSRRRARCSTNWRPGWSRFSVDLIPHVGPRDLQQRLRPQHRLRPRRGRGDARARWRTILRCCCSRTGPTSTASSCRSRCRRTGCRRCTPSPASTCRSASWVR